MPIARRIAILRVSAEDLFEPSHCYSQTTLLYSWTGHNMMERSVGTTVTLHGAEGPSRRSGRRERVGVGVPRRTIPRTLHHTVHTTHPCPR